MRPNKDDGRIGMTLPVSAKRKLVRLARVRGTTMTEVVSDLIDSATVRGERNGSVPRTSRRA